MNNWVQIIQLPLPTQSTQLCTLNDLRQDGIQSYDFSWQVLLQSKDLNSFDSERFLSFFPKSKPFLWVLFDV